MDKEIIKKLLREADTKYFASQRDHLKYDYEEHLEFNADYLLKHLKGGKGEKYIQSNTTSRQGHQDRRQNSPAGAQAKKSV